MPATPAERPKFYRSRAIITKSTRTLIERGLGADLLLLSGGVSAGKYDIVERVLADLGARFFFDRVLIQPGQPLVFGAVKETFFFGLPGNPASTMLTFELFARAALDRLSGASQSPLPLLRAKLTRDFRHKTGLTRFLPAVLTEDGTGIAPQSWQGSGDVAALARANAFLVADADRESLGGRRGYPGASQMKKLSHYDESGRARMVDVSAKAETRRTATAQAFVRIRPAVLKKLPLLNPKGNPLEVAHGSPESERPNEPPS